MYAMIAGVKHAGNNYLKTRQVWHQARPKYHEMEYGVAVSVNGGIGCPRLPESKFSREESWPRIACFHGGSYGNSPLFYDIAGRRL